MRIISSIQKAFDNQQTLNKNVQELNFRDINILKNYQNATEKQKVYINNIQSMNSYGYS